MTMSETVKFARGAEFAVTLTDRVMRNRLGSRLAYAAARQRVFEPIVTRASRVPIPKGDKPRPTP